MSDSVDSSRKCAVNLILSEGLVEQARAHTNNLPATLENLLAEYVKQCQSADLRRRRDTQNCAAHWNAFHDGTGSFADEHSTL